ncbi:hypothetical protein H6P81_009336 [Aristolochia fimbriata]|uniref:Uncharacterized protein n=1 Tax=Aristolochia fimbriata TaxID=158543 RepID=A0AAV7ENS7_ARIFI|nr:hypothetical protein H6P81_009336 [Aristolochia fimbriata]
MEWNSNNFGRANGLEQQQLWESLEIKQLLVSVHKFCTMAGMRQQLSIFPNRGATKAQARAAIDIVIYNNNIQSNNCFGRKSFEFHLLVEGPAFAWDAYFSSRTVDS